MIRKILPLLFFVLSFNLFAQITFTADFNWPTWSGENYFRVNLGNQFSGNSVAGCDAYGCLDGANAGYTATNVTLGVLPYGCTYTLYRYDLDGDGWNSGGSVTIYANGVSCGTFTMGAAYEIVGTLTIPAAVSFGCTKGAETAAMTAAVGCTAGSIPLGSGAYRDVALAANTYYSFNWANNSGGTTSGFCASVISGGAGATSASFSANQTSWYSGSTAPTLRISSNRNSCTWSATSAVMTYQHVTPTVGTPSNAGPINFCDASGNFFTPVTVSGAANGSVIWDWGSNNGVWNNNWVATTSGTCCFPKKTSNSDGNADRMRYRVTNNGCDVTGPTILNTNRYNEAPTGLNSSSTNYCAGAVANITLTASFPASINKNGTVNFYSGSCGGTLVGSVTAGDNTSTAAVVIAAPTTTTTYYVRYEPGTGTGCSNTACATTTVTVNPNASVASVTGSTPLCIGGTTTYTANSVVLSGGTGAWSSSNTGIATVNASTGLVTAVGAGTANIIYTITGGCGGTVSQSQALTVNANASVASVTGTSPLCIGGTATYTANSVVLSGGTGAWSSSNTGIATVNASTGLVTGVSAGTVNITYTITGGCGGTVSQSQSLTVRPNASVASVTGTSPLCIGGTATYTANSVVLGGGTGAWSSSNTGVATVNASTGLVTAVAAGTANIIYTITGGCGGTASAQQSVTVSATPSAAITSSSTSLCHGNTFAVTGTVTATGAWTLTLSNGQTTSGTGNGSWSITVTPTATTVYTITSLSGPACAGAAVLTGSTTLTLPTAGTSLATNGQSATCNVSGSNWVYFYAAGGNLIAAINPGGNNLGSVTATAFVSGGAILTQACGTGSNPSYTTAALGRTWVITPTNNLAASVRFPFGTGELSALATASAGTTSNALDNVSGINDLKMSRYSGVNQNASWSDNCVANGGSGGTQFTSVQAGNGATSTVNGFPATVGSSSYIQFATPGFSEFWFHGGVSSPLPVELTSFAATCADQSHVELSWTTASENNSQKFIVEKSRDMNVWDYVTEQHAAGNSNHNIDYAAADDHAYSGISYYRLIQVDNDGTEEIYGPISVSCGEGKNGMTVFPNPTKGGFTVEINSSENVMNVGLQLTDLTGKVMSARSLNLKEGKNQVFFDGEGMQSGTYLVKLNTENKEYVPVRVVITN